MKNCNCPECVSACKNDPGRLIPDDMDKISQFLGISKKDLMNKLVKKEQSAKYGIYSLAPVKFKGKNMLVQPGNVVPDYYASEAGKCIFLNSQNLCEIHPVKPFECMAYMGCKNTFLGKPYKEKTVEEFFTVKWKNYVQVE